MTKQPTELIVDIKHKPTHITFGTVVVTYIVDPFNPVTSRQTKMDLHGRTLDTYLAGYCLGAKYLVKVNGKFIDVPFEEYVVKANDSIVYVNQVSGGGRRAKNTVKQVVSIVAIVALSIVAPGLGTAAGVAMFGAGAAAAIAGAIITGTIMFAGALLINALLAPDAISGRGTSSASINAPDLESTTYSWNGIQTSRDVNKPIPVLYGTHALGGTVINNRFYYKGTDDWLGIQIALCQGEIEAISADNIKVQDAPFSAFIGNPQGSDGYFKYVSGTQDQPIMDGYSDSIYNNLNIARRVSYNDIYQFTSESTNIDFFRIHFEFPKGIYSMDTAGKKSARSASFYVNYRKVGTAGWTPVYDTSPVYQTEYSYNTANGVVWSTVYGLNGWVVTGSRSSVAYYNVSQLITFTSSSSVAYKKYFEPTAANGFPILLAPGQYEFSINRVTPDDADTDIYNVSTSNFRFLEEINSADINYGGIAMLGIDIKATDQLSSQRPNFRTTVTRKPILLAGAYRDSTNPAWICYDILINNQYGMGLSPSKINLSEFSRWALFCDGGLASTFNLVKTGWALTNSNLTNGYLVIPETDLPAGEYLTLSGINKSLSTFSATGSASVQGVATNVSMDINSITKIDRVYETLSANRAAGYYYYVYCDYPLKASTSVSYNLVNKSTATKTAPKLSYNGVFDTTADIWASLQEVAKVGRGQVVLLGTKYSCIYDSVKTVTGLYNAANSNNVSINYISQADIATEIEVQFTDKNIGYEMTSVSIQDADAITSGARTNKTSVVAKGITSEAEALVYGKYLLGTSKYIRRAVSFDADIESITQTVGDLIALQTDVTQYGKGGMVESVIGNTVILDDTIYLEQGKEYTLKIKNASNDFIKDYNFIAGLTPNPLLYTTFNSNVSTQVGYITFDDFALIVYEESNGVYSTNSIIIPEGYEIVKNDRYAFGLKGSDSLLCVITDISREGDLSRKISAVEYNASVLDFDYDNDVLQRISPLTKPRNVISNVSMSDRLVKLQGTAVAMLSVAWDSTVSSYYNIYIMEEGFKNYLIMGVKGNRFELPATELIPETQYRIYIEDATDVGVFTYKDYTITSFSSPPSAISSLTLSSSSNTIDFNISYPNEPIDFNNYDVYLDGIITSKQISSIFSLPAKLNKLVYNFKVIPVDVIGKVGPAIEATFNVVKPTITNVTYAQEKEYIVFQVAATKGSFDLDNYEASYTEGTSNIKNNTFSIIGNWVGTKQFTFKVYDTLGNVSNTYTLDVSLVVNPVRNLASYVEGKDAVLRWDAPISGLPVEYYEIEYDSIMYKSKSNQYRLPVSWLGSKTFSVRVVNTLGAISTSVDTSLVITAGTVSSLQAEVIDNNVLLRWTHTDGSLPTSTFILYKGPDENHLTLIGEKSGTFTTVFENEAGFYSYWMSAVDTAGNIGPKLSVTTKVSAPPDYVLNVSWDSTFSGTLNNARLEGGKVYLPINTTETIQSHFTSRSWTTAQAQVNAGYPLWIEPFMATGYYEEVFNYGTNLASSLITLNADIITIKGTATVTPTISLSSDGITYTDYVGNYQVYGTAFRYVKIKITVIGPNSGIVINSINVRLDSKLTNDSGTSVVTNATAGAIVNFNKPFVDVASIQVTPVGTTPMFAIYDFVDVNNPTSFIVYLYNTSGTRVTGTFSWSARGY